MKSNFYLFIFFLLIGVELNAQISTTKINKKEELVKTVAYDSTLNYLGKEYHGYAGQTLYVKGKSESLRGYGYEGFYTEYNYTGYRNTSTYKPGSNRIFSEYYALADKYFEVNKIIKHPRADQSEYDRKKAFFELVEKESRDTIYFEYDSEYSMKFPFIVVGYFEKLKQKEIGKKIIFSTDYLQSSIDIESGDVISTVRSEVWEVIDLTVEEKYFNLSFIIKNPRGNKTTVTATTISEGIRPGIIYTIEEAEKYKKKFGETNFNLILDGKVKIGMTKEMCKLSWGDPKEINETITSASKSEQWVYADNYLYFKNGVLTTIQ